MEKKECLLYKKFFANAINNLGREEGLDIRIDRKLMHEDIGRQFEEYFLINK